MQPIPSRSTEALNMALALLAVVVIGVGTATAAISVAPSDVANPAMRTLTSGSSLQLKPAYGADDEDCAWTVRRTIQPNGRVKSERKLECGE